jgi:hypothetical protein
VALAGFAPAPVPLYIAVSLYFGLQDHKPYPGKLNYYDPFRNRVVTSAGFTPTFLSV